MLLQDTVIDTCETEYTAECSESNYTFISNIKNKNTYLTLLAN